MFKALLALFIATPLYAQSISIERLNAFYAKVPSRKINVEPERDPQIFERAPDPIDVSMTPFYSEFAKQGHVRIYMGGGIQYYDNGWASDIYRAIDAQNKEFDLDLEDLALEDNTIEFTDSHGVKFEITVGHERNEFMAAMKTHDVVMYFGHSRYGRGPAFDTFQNYFRLGNVRPMIEVGAENPYFVEEPMIDTEEFPPIVEKIDDKEFVFQYRGQKSEESYLAEDSLTRRIEGGPKDFNNAGITNKKQIYFLLSCSNTFYFREPIRAKFPNTAEKIVVGTDTTNYAHLGFLSHFVTQLVRRMPKTLEMVNEINKLELIDDQIHFTVY